MCIGSLQAEDLNRTVGINTDYIKMDDFSLEREDQEFLIQVQTRNYTQVRVHQPACQLVVAHTIH